VARGAAVADAAVPVAASAAAGEALAGALARDRARPEALLKTCSAGAMPCAESWKLPIA